MQRKSWFIYLIGSLALILCLVALFLIISPQKKVQTPPPAPIRLVKTSQIGQGLFQDKEGFIKGVQTSISILKGQNNRTFHLFGHDFDSKDLIKSLELLNERLKAGGGLRESLLSLFDIYEVLKDGKPGGLLVTGYYQPRLKASFNKKEGYNTPVFGIPGDLIRVRLQDFDTSLPNMDLWGRVNGHRLLPYFDRKNIILQAQKRPDNYPILCWLKDPVDLLELQVQGSGIIVTDQQERFIHYAASNGRDYKSVGRILLKEGILPIESLDWPSIKRWAQNNPEKFNEILNRNERYVFFKWEKVGPIGCFGKVLVPGVSAAMDKRIFPPGLPVAASLSLPPICAYPGWLNVLKPNNTATLFLFNHDTGSAIKGPFRLDLYAGSGDKAGLLAGHLKHKARFFIFIPKGSPSETS